MFAFHISVYFLRRTVNVNQEIKQKVEGIFGLAETDRKFAPFVYNIGTSHFPVRFVHSAFKKNPIRLAQPRQKSGKLE